MSLVQTSMTFSRELNAEIRKYPSPAAPNPDPGVMTTLASSSILSNMSQLVSPSGQATHTYGAFSPPKTLSPISEHASRSSLALPI